MVFNASAYAVYTEAQLRKLGIYFVGNKKPLAGCGLPQTGAAGKIDIATTLAAMTVEQKL